MAVNKGQLAGAMKDPRMQQQVYGRSRQKLINKPDDPSNRVAVPKDSQRLNVSHSQLRDQQQDEMTVAA